jgi:hypothetical protein
MNNSIETDRDTQGYNSSRVSCVVKDIGNGDLVVSGIFFVPPKMVIAANPIDRMVNYSGSGLPFPSKEVAFDGEKNQIKINEDGTFKGTIKYPNKYYEPNGVDIVPCCIFLISTAGIDQVILKDPLPYKTLNYRVDGGPEAFVIKESMIALETAEKTFYNYAKMKQLYKLA